jgi:hypothetical protein
VCAALALAVTARAARADDGACNGPPECCPTADAAAPAGHHEVTLGVSILGVYGVSEQAGTWDVRFRLLEQWDASPGFAPTTQIVNEVSRESERYDVTHLYGTRCTRSRLIHSVLHTPFNLRLFPFDEQRLVLRLADATHNPAVLTYADKASRFFFSPWDAGGQSQWTFDVGGYDHRAVSAAGASDAEIAEFEVVATRRPFFFVTKVFVPLLLIVLLSFTVFWVAPDDINTQSTIVITLWLAAIALQFATASTMPQVAYSTLADDLYTLASAVLAGVLLVCVHTSYRARRGDAEYAERILTRCRRYVPAAFAIGLVATVAIAILRRDAGL